MNDRDNELIALTEEIKELAYKCGCKSRVIDSLNDTKILVTQGNYNIRTITGVLYDVLDHIEASHPELSQVKVTESLNKEKELQGIISDCHESLDNLRLKSENGINDISNHTEREFNNMISIQFKGEDFIRNNVINNNIDRLIENHRLKLAQYKRSVLEDSVSQYDRAVKRAVSSNLISEKTAYSKWSSKLDNIKMGIDERTAGVNNGSGALTEFESFVGNDVTVFTQKEKRKKNIKLMIPFFVIAIMLIISVSTTLLIANNIRKKAENNVVEQTVEQTSPTLMDQVDNLDHVVKTLDKTRKFAMNTSVQLFIKQAAIVLLVIFTLLVALYLTFFIYQNATLKRKIYTKVQKNAKKNLAVMLNEGRIQRLDREYMEQTNILIKNELDAIQKDVLFENLTETNSLSESPTEKYRKQLDRFLI